MPHVYRREFRERAIALVRAGRPVKQTAYELGISAGCLHEWIKQDRIDRRKLPGTTRSESAELRAARKRIRELEMELAIVRQAEVPRRGPTTPNRVYPVIDQLADAGIPWTAAAESWMAMELPSPPSCPADPPVKAVWTPGNASAIAHRARPEVAGALGVPS